MKTVTITCDMCEKELIGEHIEIGAQNDGYLQYKNTLAHKGVAKAKQMDALPFEPDDNKKEF